MDPLSWMHRPVSFNTRVYLRLGWFTRSTAHLYTNTRMYYTPTHVFIIHQHTYLLYTNTRFYYTPTHVFIINQHTYLLYTNTRFYYTPTHVFIIHQHTYLLYTNTCIYSIPALFLEQIHAYCYAQFRHNG